MKTPYLEHLSASVLIAIGMSSTPAIAEPTLEVSGAIEVEINSGKDHTASKSSDIALATVELTFDFKINKNVSAHILVLHEDDDTDPPVIDEGVITISNSKDESAFLDQEHHRPGSSTRQTSSDNQLFLYLNAGRMYVPFGDFVSNMISDPLTLEIAETQEAALQFGVDIGGFQASFFIFNGDADKAGADNDVVDDFGLALAYIRETDSTALDLGIDYINNMAETDTIQGVLAGAPIQNHTAGTGLHAIITLDNLTFIAEYITASDYFNTADINFNGNSARPSASNIEIAYTMNLNNQDITIAVARQTSSDIDPTTIGLPQSRNMISLSTTFADDVGLTVEYTDASDYGISDGGTGESGGMFTAQLAVQF